MGDERHISEVKPVKESCWCLISTHLADNRPFSDPKHHFQNDRSLNLMGVWSSDLYRCKADGLYFHSHNFVFVTETFFCAKNWENENVWLKFWTWISFWYTIVDNLGKINRDVEIPIARRRFFSKVNYFDSTLKFWRPSAMSRCSSHHVILVCGGCLGKLSRWSSHKNSVFFSPKFSHVSVNPLYITDRSRYQ